MGAYLQVVRPCTVWYGLQCPVMYTPRVGLVRSLYIRDCVGYLYLNPHSNISRPFTSYCTRRADTGDTCALTSPLHMARQRGSRQGLHARAPAHQSDHSTWRGSEEADKACMRALPLTSPTTPHGEAARKPTRLACARSRSPVRPLQMTGTGKRASPCIENRCFKRLYEPHRPSSVHRLTRRARAPPSL